VPGGKSRLALLDDGHPDDWTVPGNPRGDTGRNDWVVQPNSPNPGISKRPTPSPDPGRGPPVTYPGQLPRRGGLASADLPDAFGRYPPAGLGESDRARAYIGARPRGRWQNPRKSCPGETSIRVTTLAPDPVQIEPGQEAWNALSAGEVEFAQLILEHDPEKLQTFRTRSCDRANA
jgi:hypothetical protein